MGCGEGVEQDMAQAIEWFRKAAEQWRPAVARRPAAAANLVAVVGKARRRLEEAMKASQENHRIVSPGALHALDRLIVVTEHRVSVPLVHPEETTPTVGMPKKVPTVDVAFNIVEEIKDELKISGVDFLKLKKAVREFLQSENEETAASPNVL